MDYFLENSVPIWVLGAVGLTMAGIVYTSLRTRASLVAIGVVLLVMIGGLALEHFWQTPREQVDATLRGLLAAVEADDLPAVLARLSPTAEEMRGDAQTLMPQFEVDKARATGSVEVTLPSASDPTTATARARVFVAVRHRRSGMKGGDFAEVTFTFEKRGDAWLVSGYSVSEEWRRKAGELRSGR